MKASTCPGSGHRTGGWPGDQDVCPVCQRWVTINLDTGLRKHTISAKRFAEWQERQARLRAAGANTSPLWTVR